MTREPGRGWHRADTSQETEGLAARPFIAGERYTIADISLFAYTRLAGDAGFELQPYAHLRAWMARVEAQPAHLGERFQYTVDPHAPAW